MVALAQTRPPRLLNPQIVPNPQRLRVPILPTRLGGFVGAVLRVLPAASASRMAPHVVHVDAASSQVAHGTLATALFQWTATGTAIAGGTMTYTDPRPGKSAVTYNGFADQRGFNAAFICRSAGTITIALTITDEAGYVYTASTSIDIVADSRTTVYLDTSLVTGLNDGSSQANAFQTWEGASGAQLYLQNSGSVPTHLSIKRGTTLPNSATNLITGSSGQNVWIDAYGSGANPLVVDSQVVSTQAWDIRRDSENVFLENIDFQGSASRSVNAIRMRCDTFLLNVALIGCTFSSVAQATNTTELGAGVTTGFLQMNCYVSDHDQYGFYGEYDDGVFLGNTSTNTTQQNESSIRFSGFRLYWDCTYSKFIHPTSNKDALRVMTRDPTHGGEYVWITRAYLEGPVELCWNSDVNNPGPGKFQVLENSYLTPVTTAASNTWLALSGNGGSSFQDVTIRGNVFYYAGSVTTINPAIDGSPQIDSVRLVIIDNTIVFNGDIANFNSHVDGVRIERNLFISSRDAYVGAGLAYFAKAGALISARNNVWTPGNVANVSGEGNLSLANWNARAGNGGDFAQSTITTADITSPDFGISQAFTTVYGSYPAPLGSSTTDYQGRTRLHGTAGAVDMLGLAYLSSSVDAAGSTLTIVTVGGEPPMTAAELAGMTLLANGSSKSLSNLSFNNHNISVVVQGGGVYIGQTLRLTYDSVAGQIHDASATLLPSFSNQAVTNNSTAPAPAPSGTPAMLMLVEMEEFI